MAKKLTARKIEQIRPDSIKRIEIPDAGRPGLYLVVQPSGKKSWAVRYRVNGRPRKLTLTGFPSLATARKLAQEVLDEVAEGRDPAAEKQAAKRQADTGSDLFSTVAAQFVQRHARPNTRASSARQTERILAKEVLPKWGNRRIQTISKRDVLDLLDSIADRRGRKHEKCLSANRVWSVVRKLFNWAIQRDIIGTSPVAGVKAPIEERAGERILSDDEIRWFWRACHELAYPFGRFAQLLLLTGQRRAEVAGARYTEMNLGNRSWAIPGERTKNGEAHDVALSEPAFAIIESLPRIRSTENYLFTTNGESRISGYSRAKRAIDKLMRDMARERADAGAEIPPWTFHDLRRTAASGMARLGTPLPVIEKVLNHVSGSFAGVVGVYQRHHFAEEKRMALENWGKFVLSLAESRPVNVMPLRAARP